MTDNEAITAVLGKKLKRELEEWNFYHPKNKIKYSPVCRKALKNELDEKKALEAQWCK
jgi:hypothetical protein